jgi:GNAT superfamily N-acetyltransferase
MRIRRATEKDLPALGLIFVAAARGMIERYQPEAVGAFPPEPERLFPTWRHLLQTGSWFVAEDPDPVGFSTAVVRDGVWFLSQLWVAPEHQGRGVGAVLLDEALAWGKGASAFTVVASPDPAAQALYLRRSMFPVWVQHELVGPGGGAMPAGLEPLTEEDLPWLDRLDREVRGIARPEDHRYFLSVASGLALRREGEPLGYVYAWGGGRVGPGAAAAAADVPVLIRAGLAAVGEGRDTGLFVPSANWAAMAELVRRGFRLRGGSTFMASRRFPDGSRYVSSGGALA